MKFMNLKRFASVAMAGVMTLSLAVPAFATNTTVITGTYQDIEIAVEVPTTGEAQINPYGLPVTLTKSDRTTVDLVDQKITTQPMSIKNQGTVALDVNASLAVLPKGDVAIGAAVGTDKTIKVELEVAALNDSELAVSVSDRTLEDALIDKFADDASWANSQKLTAPAAAKAATTVTPAKSSAALASLGAATVDGTAITYGPKSIALVRLSGDVAESPVVSSADTPWTTADGFTATVVFSFKPTQKIAVTVSGTGISNQSTGLKAYEGETVTFTFEATSGKACTAAITGAGSTPTVTVTEDGSTGVYTGTFVMPADDTTAGITVTVTVPA